jgi:lysophospholipase L1-like esterase
VKLSYLAVSAATIMAAAVAIGAAVAPGASAATAPAHDIVYDLSLGDSLAVGDQPNASGTLEATDQGYANDIFTKLKSVEAWHGKKLELVNFGCAGETSTSMIGGGTCSYPDAASQLDAAERFLSAHGDQVVLVTLSIGANDVDSCATTASINTTCVAEGLQALESNIGTITGGLRKADPSPATTFAGINLYDPFLATWLSGSPGETLATESVTLVGDLNTILQDGYAAAGYKVANAAGAFKITDFSPTVSLPGVGQVPLNVDLTCKLSYMCASAPVGPNIHPDAAGYAVIAQSLESASKISGL